MHQSCDFARIFSRLAQTGQAEATTLLGGVAIRLVRIPAGHTGRWDRHDATTETALVWTGDFTVDYRDGTTNLTAGQCCVVPRGAEHRGRSQAGADIVLFQQAP